MRCKACDAKIGEYDQYRRTVVDTLTGKRWEVYEDLCKRCRDSVYREDEDDTDRVVSVFVPRGVDHGED